MHEYEQACQGEHDDERGGRGEEQELAAAEQTRARILILKHSQIRNRILQLAKSEGGSSRKGDTFANYKSGTRKELKGDLA